MCFAAGVPRCIFYCLIWPFKKELIMSDNRTLIIQLKDFAGQQVTLAGWVYQARSSGKVQFIILRDGSGLCQCVVEKGKIPDDVFDKLEHLGQESSLTITGLVRAEPRSVGGYRAGRNKRPGHPRHNRLPHHAKRARRRFPPQAPPSAPSLAKTVVHRQNPPHGHRRHQAVLQR